MTTTPTTPDQGDERRAFVQWLGNTFPHSYDEKDAEHYWQHGHVSALAWQARAALAAPQPSQGVEREAYIADLIDTFEQLRQILGTPEQDADALIAASRRLASESVAVSGEDWREPKQLIAGARERANRVATEGSEAWLAEFTRAVLALDAPMSQPEPMSTQDYDKFLKLAEKHGAIVDVYEGSQVEFLADQFRAFYDELLSSQQREPQEAAEVEMNLLRVECAGLGSSVGHLSSLVDHLRELLRIAVDAMSALHAAAKPDENTEEIDAIVPGGAFADFVDVHAALLRQIANGPAAAPQEASKPTDYHDPERLKAWEASKPVEQLTASVSIDFKQATDLLDMFGGEPTEITLMTGTGHSGDGLYAVYNADPEGSVYLGETDEEAAPESKEASKVEPVAGERELDLYDEIECDLHYLFGRASAEGHESGQRLADQVKAKMQRARANPAPNALEIQAVEELAQLGYTVRDGLLYPPANEIHFMHIVIEVSHDKPEGGA